MAKLIGTLVMIFAFATMAEARVHSITPTQWLKPPDAYPFEVHALLAVAIDGDSLIVIADRPGYRGAFLYRRRAADRHWSFSRTLMRATAPPAQLRAGLVMKNSLAVIDLAGEAFIWERVPTGWIQGRTISPIRLPGGYSISDDRVLIGGDGCSTDGFVFEKTSAGAWGVSGRLPSPGTCVAGERDVDLNYGYALVNSPAGNIRAYRRNGTAIDWVSAGNFQLQGQSMGQAGPTALQKAIAAAPGSTIYRRSGTTWTLDQTLMPADYAMGTGDAQAVVYRDGVLVTVEGLAQEWLWASPHLYVPDANGKFQNAGILEARGNTFDVDVSKGTVVAASEDQFGIVELAVFELPTPLMPPKAIVNDFNTRDVSGFQTTPNGAYTLVGSGSQWFYRQPTTSGATQAVITGSDWSYYQSINVRISPASTGPGQWAGAALRYIDADNYYFVSIYYDRMTINRRLNGVNTELSSTPLGGSTNNDRFRDLHFHIQRNPGSSGGVDQLSASLDILYQTGAYDSSLTHGSAALLTHETRADFDNLYVSPSVHYALLFMNFVDNPGRPLETRGGTWTEENTEWPYGVRQSDTSVLATAVGGAPVDDQRVRADIFLESFGSVSPVPWFGLIARYRDPMNYYSLSVRGSGQLQIRKLVNGVMTVLAAKPFTVNPGEYHRYELHAFGDQLHAVVDRVVIATAHDSDLPLGRHGVATYRTSALFNAIIVDQP